MSDRELADELTQMTRFYRMLCGLVYESMVVLNAAELSSEERLRELREKLQFVQQYLYGSPLPHSVKAELDANPAVQAVLADIARRRDPDQQEGSTSYFVQSEDGAFHKMVIRSDEGLRPVSDAELRALFPEDGETV